MARSGQTRDIFRDLVAIVIVALIVALATFICVTFPPTPDPTPAPNRLRTGQMIEDCYPDPRTAGRYWYLIEVVDNWTEGETLFGVPNHEAEGCP